MQLTVKSTSIFFESRVLLIVLSALSGPYFLSLSRITLASSASCLTVLWRSSNYPRECPDGGLWVRAVSTMHTFSNLPFADYSAG